MIKLTAISLGLFHLTLNAMEGVERVTPSEWRSKKLSILLDESKWPTCNQWNKEVRELKAAFVEKYLDKYNDQQEILKDLSRESGGVIRATSDLELATEDPNKFLCLDALQCTADEIDARWQRIHKADCKYISDNVAKYGSYEKRPVSSGKQ